MKDEVSVDDVVQPVSAILELSVDDLGEVWFGVQAPAKCLSVEELSDPNNSAASMSPAAMAAANSLSSRCGPWPPTTSRTARAEPAPTRLATERG